MAIPRRNVAMPWSTSPVTASAPAQDAEGEGFLRHRRDALRNGDGLPGQGRAPTRVTTEQTQAGRLREGASAGDRRRFGRDQAQGLGHGSLSRRVVAGFPQVPAQALVEHAHAVRVGRRSRAPRATDRLGLGDGGTTKLDGPVVGSSEHGALGGALHQAEPIHRRRIERRRLPLAQLERAFVVAPRLRESVYPLGRGTGCCQGRDGANDVARRDPVIRELGRRDRDVTDLPAPLQFAPERRMEAFALAVEQVAGGDLGHERVPEGIATEAITLPSRVDEDPLVDRRSKRVGDRLFRHVEHGREQLLVDAAARSGGGSQDSLRVVWQARQPGDQDVAELRRQVAAVLRVLQRRRQLLDEERIAAGPLQDVVDDRRGRGAWDQGTQEGRHVPTIEPLEIEPCDPRVTLELGDQGQGRIPAGEFQGPERDQEQHRRGAQVPGQEAEQAARAVVGPLDVLDDEHHRPDARLAFDDREQGFEEPRLSGTIEFEPQGCLVGPRRDLGEQARDLVPRRSEQRRQASRLHGTGQTAERLDEGRIGDRATPRRQARAGHDRGATVPRRVPELRDEPALADARLATNDDRGPATEDRRVEEGLKARLLGAAPDERSPIETVEHCPPMIAMAASRTVARMSRTKPGLAGQQPGTHLGPSPTKKGPRREIAPSDRPGDLRAAVALRREDQSLAVDAAESFERRSHGPLLFAGHGQALRRWCPVGNDELGPPAIGHRDPAPPAHREVVADPVQPCAGLVGDAAGADLGGQSLERVVRQILGRGGIAGDAGQIALQLGAVRQIRGCDDPFHIESRVGSRVHGRPSFGGPTSVPAVGRRSV
jgi:hypothetical protein